ncbi:uncharacterized protein LOC127256334 isoform X2 [Andrographis paniculata]|nr:uncharacterized protein LOC127256334 isoform X2 [Andrographis paniculata]
MMQDTSKFGVLAVQTLRNNIMASTVLASTAIMLSSVIAVLMTGGRGRAELPFQSSKLGIGFSIKLFSILVCFLVAFLLNVQSIRYYSHASILINVPSPSRMNSSREEKKKKDQKTMTAENVARIVNRGSYFWSLGLRAFYLSLPLFMWIFGAVAMASSCFILVFALYFLDVSSFHCSGDEEEEEEGDEEKADHDRVVVITH